MPPRVAKLRRSGDKNGSCRASIRHCSRDPIGFEGSPCNLYRCVDNNPLKRIDPSGKKWAACYVAAFCIGGPWAVCMGFCATDHWDNVDDTFNDCMAKCIKAKKDPGAFYDICCIGAVVGCLGEAAIRNAGPIGGGGTQPWKQAPHGPAGGW